MRVLLAVDGSRCSESAVTAVLTRFQPSATEIRVVHAVEWLKEMPFCFQYGQGSTAASGALDCRNDSFERATALVNRVAGRFAAAGFPVTVATPDADPRHGIVDEASRWKADLIVLGSHGRHGLDRMLMGSVAEGVLRHAPCAVEVVREPRAA